MKEKDDDDDDDLRKDGKKTDPDWANKWVGSDGFIKIRKTWNDIGKFIKETFSPSENKWVDNGFGGMDSLFTKYPSSNCNEIVIIESADARSCPFQRCSPPLSPPRGRPRSS